MSPRPRSSSSITSLSCWSAGTSCWKFRTASSISALVSAVDMRCGILSRAMDYEHLRYEQDGPVTVITIDRPERMNAVGPATAARAGATPGRASATTTPRSSACSRARATTRSARAATSRPRSRASTSCRSRAGGARRARARRAPRHPRPDALDRPGKPTIAAVNGVAYAGGLEWACWTDLVHRRRARDVRRHLPALEHRPRRRRHAAAAAHRRLPRRDGADPHRPRDRRARGARGSAWSNEVVPRGTCRERARELAHAIAALPQPAIRTDKEAAVRGFGRPLDEGLRIEAECFNRLLDGPEMAEGLRRFNERDHPDRRAAARRRRRVWRDRGGGLRRAEGGCGPPGVRPRGRFRRDRQLRRASRPAGDRRDSDVRAAAGQ